VDVIYVKKSKNVIETPLYKRKIINERFLKFNERRDRFYLQIANLSHSFNYCCKKILRDWCYFVASTSIFFVYAYDVKSRSF